jgi:hypothetical protein
VPPQPVEISEQRQLPAKTLSAAVRVSVHSLCIRRVALCNRGRRLGARVQLVLGGLFAGAEWKIGPQLCQIQLDRIERLDASTVVILE